MTSPAGAGGTSGAVLASFPAGAQPRFTSTTPSSVTSGVTIQNPFVPSSGRRRTAVSASVSNVPVAVTLRHSSSGGSGCASALAGRASSRSATGTAGPVMAASSRSFSARRTW